jgi:gas vesicle protein
VFATIAPALFGLLGTVVGGLLTFLQQERNGRETRASESRERANEQQEKWRETRRQAAVEFVGQVDRLSDRTREYWASLDDDSLDAESREAIKAAYLDAWRVLVGGFASFQITVSPELNEAGTKLRNAVTAYTEAVEAIAASNRRTQKATDESVRTQDEAWNARRQFIAVAHTDLEVRDSPYAEAGGRTR